MSLYSSMTTAVSGLNAQAKSISTVSTNLANTSTTSYKSKGTTFEELTTLNNSESGSVEATTDYENDAQGTISGNDVSTYLAISGSGYFAVKSATMDSSGNITFSDETYYTRQGDFTLNSEGYLENSAGYYLVGWNVDPATDAVNTSTLVPIQITALEDDPVPTTSVAYTANLPASATIGTTTSASTLSVYDSTGTAHTMSYTWTKTGTDTWDLSVSIADGGYDSATNTTGDYTSVLSYTFNTDGTVADISTSSGTATVDATTGVVSFSPAFSGAADQTITCDFENTTQYTDESLTVSTFTQNGASTGDFDSLTIDTNGNISINYTTGISRTYYEIPIATFNSYDNLQEEDYGVYEVTTTSGAVTYCAAGTSGAGTVEDKSLENSNVDIATQFSVLIQAQQAYSGNTKIVSAVDTMTKDTIDLL